ncbi:MAG TPA: CocE/NonD family hydrolase [Verrucomicrobiae bacterium]
MPLPYLVLLIVLSFAARLTHAAELPPLDLGNVREEHFMIPMRDGVKLSAYVYFPDKVGPHPVIFEQRYVSITNAATRKEMAKLAENGYVVAKVNFRGSHESEGVWQGYRALGWGEQQDGYDLVEWFARQAWCNRKVGTFGGSQGGFAQNFLAVSAPPHLVCQYMMDTGLSLFHEGYRIGGIYRPLRHAELAKEARDPVDNLRLMEEWFRHPTYDDYWKAEDCTPHFGRMNVPCFTIGSWYDFMSVGSIQSYLGRQTKGGGNSQKRQKLLLGPWLHGGYPKPNKVGDLVYPENAQFDVYAHMIKWFDFWLKGINNGVMNEPNVRYYVMGALDETGAPGNVWRTAKSWPPDFVDTPYYLHEGGNLAIRLPSTMQSTTSYESDPNNPMQIPGRNFPGARDARRFEEQADVLTFTTEPLKNPVEWTGKVRADLYVASTAKDTDFIVRISDVYPDGRSILIMDYIHRTRFREGWDKEVFMESGQVYRVIFDVGSLSQIFNAGHRIRVTIASTGAPLYEPNPQTGEPLTMNFPATTVKAVNTIYHQKRNASRILAPVVRIP